MNAALLSCRSTLMPPIGVPDAISAFLRYKGKLSALMPDMERLTWKGIALHVGDLPGYPDSHGCVHLPPDFADDVYAITQIGTPVILAGGHSDRRPLRIQAPFSAPRPRRRSRPRSAASQFRR